MRNLIGYIIENLVDSPDAIEIRDLAGDRVEVYEVSVAPRDQGRLIGKQGRTIRSIRSLVNAAASRAGKKASVEVLD